MSLRRLAAAATVSFASLVAGCATPSGQLTMTPPWLPQSPPTDFIMGKHQSIANADAYNGWKLRPMTLEVGNPYNDQTAFPPRAYANNWAEFKIYPTHPEILKRCATQRTGYDYDACQAPTVPSVAFFQLAGQTVMVPTTNCRLTANGYPQKEIDPMTGAQTQYVSAICGLDTRTYTTIDRHQRAVQYRPY